MSNKEFKDTWKESDKLFVIIHDFQKMFIEPPYYFPAKFKYKGYELSKRVERWAKKHPTVQIIRCDDCYHSGSDLILIPHATSTNYHGTTVIFIPQCSGEEPIEFFLYPTHLNNLVKALLNIRKNNYKKKGWRI